MRVAHKYRLPRKYKKKIGKYGWFRFMYARIVSEEYPYGIRYKHYASWYIDMRNSSWMISNNWMFYK